MLNFICLITLGVHQEPPAFWSTQTPRVKFSDDPGQRYSPGILRNGFSDQELVTDPVSDQGDYRMAKKNIDIDLLDYHGEDRNGSEKLGSSKHISPHTSPSHRKYCKSPHSVKFHDETAIMHNQRKSTRNHSPEMDGRKSPLTNVAYKTGYKFASGYLSDPEGNFNNEKPRSSSYSSSSSSSESEEHESRRISRTGKYEEEKRSWKLKSEKKVEKRNKQKKIHQVKDEKTNDKKKKKERENKEKCKTCDTDETKQVESLFDPDLPIHKKDKKDTDPGGPSTRVLKTKQGGLNFINDSGTQINFWGTPPDEVVKKVKELIPDAKVHKDKEALQEELVCILLLYI